MKGFVAAIGHHHTHKALATSYVYVLPMKVSVERQLALRLTLDFCKWTYLPGKLGV